MAIYGLRVISFIFVALAFIPAGAHFFAMFNKMKLDGPSYLAAQRAYDGWSLFGIVWGLAIAGVALKGTFGARLPMLSTAVYLGMGWLAIVALRPLLLNVAPRGIAWLVAGGLFYTLGVVFYVSDERRRYRHAVWHLFVLAGSMAHFCAVLWYALPVSGSG